MFDESSFDSQSFEETSWLFGIIPIIIAGASWGIAKATAILQIIKSEITRGFSR